MMMTICKWSPQGPIWAVFGRISCISRRYFCNSALYLHSVCFTQDLFLFCKKNHNHKMNKNNQKSTIKRPKKNKIPPKKWQNPFNFYILYFVFFVIFRTFEVIKLIKRAKRVQRPHVSFFDISTIFNIDLKSQFCIFGPILLSDP